MSVEQSEGLARGDPAATTRVTLLDEIAVASPSGSVTADHLPGVQPQTTFAYLVLHRDAPVPVERLGEAVWGSERPATWQPALRALVAKARAFAGTAHPDASLTSGPSGYVLHLPPPVEVDIEIARQSARYAEQALRAAAVEDAVTQAARAADLARRVFLPRSRGSWAGYVAEELDGIRLRSLHVLGEVHLLRGEPERAVRAAREAIDVTPLHEASHRLMMRALVAAGEAARAAQAFDHCRRLLREELGIDPSQQTTELFTSILRD